MNRGFYTIMAAQFFSSLADNALLIAAIALLAEMHSPAWMTPLLKLFFVLPMCCWRLRGRLRRRLPRARSC
jgi:hypothetical protein